MKRILLVLMSVFMLALLVGCGSDTNKAADSAKLAKIQERNEELESKLETKAQDMQLRWWKEGGLIAGIGALAGVILVYLPRPRRRREDYY